MATTPGYYLKADRIGLKEERLGREGEGLYDSCLIATRPDTERLPIRGTVYGAYEGDKTCTSDDDCGIAQGDMCTGGQEVDEDDWEEERAEVERGGDELAEEEGVPEREGPGEAEEELDDEFEGEMPRSTCGLGERKADGARQDYSPGHCFGPPQYFPNPNCAAVANCEDEKLHRLADGTLCNACGAASSCYAEKSMDGDGGILIFLFVIYTFQFCCAVGCFYGTAYAVGGRQNFKFKYHDCFGDMGVCLTTFWCPCMTWGQNAAFGMGDNDPMMRNPIAGCMICFWVSCLIQACCSIPVFCCFGMVTRQGIRDKLGIAGDVWEDVCLHLCGFSCALCQEQREIQDAIEAGRFEHDGRSIAGPEGGPITPMQTVTATATGQAMLPGYNPNMPMATATIAGMPIASATLGGAGMGANSMPTVTANPGGFTLGVATASPSAVNPVTTSANPMALNTATAAAPSGPAREMPQGEMGEALL